MSSTILLYLICLTLVLLLSLLVVAIPLKYLAVLTTPFSFYTFGIRKIKRWHSRTDTLGNFMIWITVFLAVLAPWLPFAPIIWIVWLTFAWLCCLARAVRLTAVTVKWKKILVIFFLNMWFGFGLVSVIGVLDHFTLWARSFMFANEIMNGEALNLMFYLSSPQPACYLLQTAMLLTVGWSLWGQFKYMRLENTFKAVNLGAYGVKCTFLSLLLLAASYYGPSFLETIYQVPEDQWIVNIHAAMPMDRSEVEGYQDDHAGQPAHDFQQQIQQEVHPSDVQTTPVTEQPEEQTEAAPEETPQETPDEQLEQPVDESGAPEWEENTEAWTEG